MEYTASYKMRVCECDNQDRMRFSSMWDLAQETATLHAQKLGMTADVMHKRGFFWALCKMKLDLLHSPSWGEEVRVKTFVAGVHKLYAMRGYSATDESGREIARGISSWVVLDKTTFKPQRVNKVFPDFCKYDYTGEILGKIDMPSGLKPVSDIRVEFSDLDVNNHTNNTRYINWIENAIRPGREIRSVEAAFLQQTTLGEALSVLCEYEDNDAFLELTNESGISVFRAKANLI